MQTQGIGQYIIKTPANAGTIHKNNTGDIQDDDQDNTNYECMEQFKEFEFDAEIYPTTTDAVLTNTTECLKNMVKQEWGHYLQPTQAIAEIGHKLPTIREIWQLLLEGPNKNLAKEVLFQNHMRTKSNEHMR